MKKHFNSEFLSQGGVAIIKLPKQTDTTKPITFHRHVIKDGRRIIEKLDLEYEIKELFGTKLLIVYTSESNIHFDIEE